MAGGDFFQDLHEKHERLKKRIHSFRIPLSPRGQAVMKVVYFSIPVIGGYFIMEVMRMYVVQWRDCYSLV